VHLPAQYQAIFATAVFLVTYGIIMSEKVHRTIIAFFGAALVVITGILPPERAVEAIDWNTIGLLTGMMIIVGLTRQTGLFEYLAIKAARLARGSPLAIMAALSGLTAFVSAFLDNVTTVLLIVPITFAIASQLEVSPVPFLIPEILASNIGGTATLIGDPPNIMIGSATGLGFMDFVFNLTPIIVVVHFLTVFCFKLIYRRQLVSRPELMRRITELDERKEIKDPVLLRKCLIVLGVVILGFVVHQYVHLESSVIALSGAALLLLLDRKEPEHALQAVEWPVIFFFVGLFVVVGALEAVGVIEAVARFSLEVTGGAMMPTAMLILWLSAILSAFIDNIPFVATMIPMIQDMGRLGGIMDLNLLWWALSLGACLGGNGTAIGASANVVVIGMMEKRGIRVTFMEYMKVAFPLMLLSIVACTFYLILWNRYHVGWLSLAAVLFGVVLSFIDRLVMRRLQAAAPGRH
jgi:Na+/H+ antiporter NhaD/arsenite permease-like protein